MPLYPIINGSYVSKTFNVSKKLRLRSKTWKHKWLWYLFFSLSFFLWTDGWLWFKWHLANGMETLTWQKAVWPLIYNPLADTLALAWLLVFEDLGNFFHVSGVSNGSITTFLKTISAVRFLSSLCLVITSPPFGQNKACCNLNESPRTHIVGKRSRRILYLIRIASQKACFSRKKPFLFIGITVNQIDAPFSVDASINLNIVLHDALFVLHPSTFCFGFWCYFLFMRLYWNLKFPVVLPIQTLLLQILLYFHSSQRQHLHHDVHPLLSLLA